MSSQDEAFLKRLRATFALEAREHLQRMSSCLLTLENEVDPEGQAVGIDTVFRHAHSLKGAARAVEAVAVEAVCQALEDVLAGRRRRGAGLAKRGIDTLLGAIDLIGTLVEDIAATPTAGSDGRVAAAIADLRTVETGGQAPSTPPVASVDEARPPGGTGEAPVAGETIRVSVAKLERLLLQAEEIFRAKQALTHHAAELRHIEAAFDDWAVHWQRAQAAARGHPAIGRPSGPAHATPGAAVGVPAPIADFLEWNLAWVKALELSVEALVRTVTRDRHTVGKQVDDLLADSKTLLMLPFSVIGDLFPRLVRDLARDQGKEVELVMHGGDVEIGKRVLEGIKDTLVHLLRNAIDHGIERAEQRLRANKTARARLSLTVTPVDGGKVEIVVADDGAGVDLGKVRAAAVRSGLLSEADAQALTDDEAIDLIFRSELSTSAMITEISGRGLGLAIARQQATELGGRISVDSRLGEGTRFRIIVPMTLATLRGVLVRLADRIFAIPSAYLECVVRLGTDTVKTVENRETIALDGQTLALARLEEVLEMPPVRTADPDGDMLQVVVVSTGGTRIAFAVDEVLYDEELLAKPLGRPLSRVRNIGGAAILADGRIAPILNVADLILSAIRLGDVPRRRERTPVSVPLRSRCILLAEDSITSRMLLKGILESAGYAVETAVDGVDAFTRLRTGEFDLLVSDVEMPRLDGFDLTARIRGDKALAELPVVLVTARASAEDRERGIDVGANAYIVKSSFDQTHLLDAVRRLV